MKKYIDMRKTFWWDVRQIWTDNINDFEIHSR